MFIIPATEALQKQFQNRCYRISALCNVLEAYHKSKALVKAFESCNKSANKSLLLPIEMNPMTQNGRCFVVNKSKLQIVVLPLTMDFLVKLIDFGIDINHINKIETTFN
ncbi:hypothetical protein U3516DRAFT_764713 [Neocallimastix sp. 'constans']